MRLRPRSEPLRPRPMGLCLDPRKWTSFLVIVFDKSRETGLERIAGSLGNAPMIGGLSIGGGTT